MGNVVNALVGIGNILQNSASLMITSQDSIITLLRETPEFVEYYHDLLGNVLIFAIISYILWSLFQGLNFGITHGMIKKTNIAKYLFKFSWINLIWCGVTALLFFIYLRWTLSNRLTFIPIISRGTISVIMGIFFIIICYFSFISYGLLAHNTFINTLKNTFVIGVKNILHLLLMFLIIILSLGIIFTLILLSAKLTAFLSVIIIIIVLLPALYFSRIYLITTLSSLRPRTI
jgi:hypothetical protein